MTLTCGTKLKNNAGDVVISSNAQGKYETRAVCQILCSAQRRCSVVPIDEYHHCNEVSRTILENTLTTLNPTAHWPLIQTLKKRVRDKRGLNMNTLKSKPSVALTSD